MIVDSTTPSYTPVQELIEQCLTKSGKEFVSLRQVFKTPANYKLLDLTAKATTKDLIASIEPHLGDHFCLYRKSNGTYLGRKCEHAELVLTIIRSQVTAKTLAQLAQSLPFSKIDLAKIVNPLLASGQLSVQFNHDGEKVRLFIGQAMVPAVVETVQKDDPATFRAAYDKVRNGKDTVRIHRLREQLGWDQEHFDKVLANLRAEYQIDVHLGNPARLTAQEIANSYIDPHGELYIGLSWRD